jgi:hypothetical protein
MNETDSPEEIARKTAIIVAAGFVPTNARMIFTKDGRWYDLSAADLGQLERIEREGLCRAWPDCRIYVGWDNGSYLTTLTHDFTHELADLVARYGPPTKLEYREPRWSE